MRISIGVFANVSIGMGARRMQVERDEIEEVFQLIREASEKLWKAVAVLQEGETTFSVSLVQPPMLIRDDIHVNFIRPTYMKFPDACDKVWAGWRLLKETWEGKEGIVRLN